MASADNRFRKKWQDYSGLNATGAEHSFFELFARIFEGSDYEIVAKPQEFRQLYMNVKLLPEDENAIYKPPKPIKQHGVVPDGVIINKKTGKKIYIEIKRQDGWVEGKTRHDGRGNAHERMCKYFTPGLLAALRNAGNISDEELPFWVVFQGDITRDPCRVREISFWFGDFRANYFFWRDTSQPLPLIEHFEKYIVPILEHK